MTNSEFDNQDLQQVPSMADVVKQKLLDAQTGFTPEFTPDEATLAGAFIEDALSAKEASDSTLDLEAFNE
ncbi:hypothetical protein KAM329D_32110 [Aeromonas caviae]|uniref:conjugal transfer protein TraD n=1 Tax=Aeromonas caviae TaxID=648 RepID=UPI0018A3E53F|nr:conjugal transfer protein TraD [Aeromonas caviae]MDH1400078.1 conjugal transfer protein TraD [Aeromonas caviae]BCM78172.1 hypothetical protein KAM329_47240 [Aeromonas caviae]GJA15506.1 hypothetical protein KAM335_27020 [Aeromonas caviae]GJA25508.1 hypothetical protein KAM337_40360 [Aeromonas caviae]GJC24230.1 hypothetical protein KAM329D_32110 [Aeromonas caviae]